MYDYNVQLADAMQEEDEAAAALAVCAAELDRLSGLDGACVVVEADLDTVLRGRAAAEIRGVRPASLLGAAVRIGHTWGVPVFWCGSRPAARAFTEAYLRMFVRTCHERPRP